LFHNKQYGTDLRKESFTSYLVHEICGGTLEEGKAKVREFYGSDSFRSLPPVRDAPIAVRRLARSHRFAAVTSRPHETEDVTRMMIDRHFAGLIQTVHHTDTFGFARAPRAKDGVCVEIGATVMIEDNIDHAVLCANAGMYVILFDQPWNRKPVPPCGKGTIVRVRSWAEILAILS
jgi:uncharacterized HAD superfamily protein